MAKRPYSITLSVANLAALGTGSDSHSMDNGETFVAESITATTLEVLTGITDAAKPFPLLLVNFSNGSGGAKVFNELTPLANVAGDAKQPFILNQPIILGGTPFMDIKNISTDKTYAAVYVTLHGYRETAGG